jgi:N6-adenosine-specific RNA methylase IME4
MLKIDQEFKSLIPPLTAEEYAQLEKNVIAEGCRDALVIWQGTIIDGHNRYEICQKHSISYEIVEKDFDSREKAKEWIILNQFGRRNLSAYDRSILALKLKEILEERAKEKEKLRKTIEKTKAAIDVTKLTPDKKAIIEVLSDYKKRAYAMPDRIYFVQHEDKVKIGCSSDVNSRIKDITRHLPDAKLIGTCKGSITLEKELHKLLAEHRINNEWFEINDITVTIIKSFVSEADFVNIDKVNSREIAAKKFNISEGTLYKVEKIERQAPEEIKTKLRNQEMSINQAYQTVRRLEKVKAVEEKFTPKGTETKSIDIYNTDNKYNIIYADPPWKYWEGGQKNQSLHYKTMTIEEICELPVKNIADNDCILFLWVTYPILQECFKVIEAWGFKYSTAGFVWVKKNKNTDTPFIGCGSWTRANTELCLIATKGSVLRLDASISQVIESPIEEHSKKPAVTRELITKLVGELPRIELFSRQAADGWDCWGNEV